MVFGRKKRYTNSNGATVLEWRDKNGNIIHYKDSTGEEWWKDYDEKGNLTHFKQHGYEYWQKFNSTGQCIYREDNKGCNTTYIYNEENILVDIIENHVAHIN